MTSYLPGFLQAQSDRVRLAKMEDGAHVFLRGRGMERASLSIWRHAGGREDWTVRCKCGITDDDGARMVSVVCLREVARKKQAGFAEGDVMELGRSLTQRMT